MRNDGSQLQQSDASFDRSGHRELSFLDQAPLSELAAAPVDPICRALRALMLEMPKSPPGVIQNKLERMIHSAGATAEVFLGETLPVLLETLPKPFRLRTLELLTQICETFREYSCEVVDLFLRRVPFKLLNNDKLRLPLAQFDPEKTTSLSALHWAKFTCNLLGVLNPRTSEEVNATIECTERLWRSWGSAGERGLIAKTVKLAMELAACIEERDQRHMRILGGLDCLTDPRTAAHVISYQLHLPQDLRSTKSFVEQAKMVKGLENMFPETVSKDRNTFKELVEYCGMSVRTGEPMMCKELLYRLAFEVFSIPRVAIELPWLTENIRALSELPLKRRHIGYTSLKQDLPELGQIADELPRQDQIKMTPAARIVAGILINGMEPTNPFRKSVAEKFSRLDLVENLQGASRLKISRRLTVAFSPEGPTMRVKQGKELDIDFVVRFRDQFDAPSERRQEKLIQRIEWTLNKSSDRKISGSGIADVYNLLLRASQVFEEKEKDTHRQRQEKRNNFQTVVLASLPLLPLAEGAPPMTLSKELITALREDQAIDIWSSDLEQDARAARKERNEDAVRDFIYSRRQMLADSVVHTLLARGMTRRAIDDMKKIAGCGKAQEQLDLFVKLKPRQSYRAELFSSRNAIARCPDLVAETCNFRVDDERTGRRHTIEDHIANLDEFGEGLLLHIPETRDIIGEWFIGKKSIDGGKYLVLAGGGLRASVAKSIDLQEFHRDFLKQLKAHCRKHKLAGCLQIVGAPTDEKRFTNEGRIGQNEEVVRTLIPPDAEIFRLNSKEEINFPLDFRYGPGRYAATLFFT